MKRLSNFFGILIGMMLGMMLSGRLKRYQRIRRRVKYFNPVITEGFWGKKITWVGRDTPLTEAQLKKLS
jgi:hypothetical protein